MEKYLFGIHWDPFEGIPGIYVTKHHLQGFRYFSTYKNGKASKPAIFKALAEGGMVEDATGWDWHHVVEGKDLKPLFATADYKREYDLKWPTVLMHSAEEHKILNSLFRSTSIFGNPSPASVEPLKGNERLAYIKTLRDRYSSVYAGDSILQKLAQNFIVKL